MSRQYDEYMMREYDRDMAACVECGYHRKGNHHPKIVCPQTGRCGDCGNDWPCADHSGMTGTTSVQRRLRDEADMHEGA